MRHFEHSVRPLLAGQLLVSVGAGVLTTGTIVYLLRSVGLDAADVGVGLIAAGLLGFAPLPAVGPLLDRYGGRPVALVAGVVATAATAGFVRIDSVATFIAFEGVSNAALQVMYVAQRSLAGQLMTGEDRIRYVAWNRAAANVGVAVGALLAAPALILDDRRVYLLTFLAAAAAIAAALPCVWLGPAPPLNGRDAWQRPWVALANVRYMVMTLLCGLLTARHRVLAAAVPLWIVLATAAPASIASALLLVNTGMVVLLQVRVSARADTLAGATRAMRLGGLAFAAAFTGIVLAAAFPRWPAAALLVVAVIPFTLGEMWTSAASWTYSYELAPPGRHGRYQAAFALGRLAGEVAGPLLVTLATLGAAGWAGLTIFFLSCCALAGAAAPWAAQETDRSVTI